MKRDVLVAALTELLRADEFQDYGPNGLQVAGAAEVRVLATATSASLAACRRAAGAGAQVLLVHHGLFWGGRQAITGALKLRLRVLLAADCSLLAYHLPLDAHPELGNNAEMLRRLGARDAGAFARFKGTAIGRHGHLRRAATTDDFQRSCAEAFGHAVFHSPGGPERIRRIGAVSGGGHGALEEAAELGLDAMVTGELSEPVWHLTGELGIHCFACGHHATECLAVRALGSRLADEHGLEHVDADAENPL